VAKSSLNLSFQAALDYHESTKHSAQSIRDNPHFLDWENQPLPFKIYHDVESIPLPQEQRGLDKTTPAALEAISALPDPEIKADVVPDIEILAQVLYLAAGITKVKRYAGGEVYFRAYSNTGALYHIDLYLVTQDLPGLSAGVFQFGPHDFALHQLRAGDFRGVLVAASGDHPRVAHAPAILVSASTYWRNAWKYQARAYRHCFWDSGTLHANLMAIAQAHALQPSVIVGFADALVETLLGLNPQREAALTLVPLGSSPQDPAASPSMPTLRLETEPLSASEIDYPQIREIHRASSLENTVDAAGWRAKPPIFKPDPLIGSVRKLRPLPSSELPTESLASVIRRRGSTRAFDASRAMTFEALSTLLRCATSGLDADFLVPRMSTLIDLYLIVHAVEGLPPGTYYFRRDNQTLELLAAGDFRNESGYLGLSQELPRDAAVNVYCLASLTPILERFGNRGYRAAQLEGGIIGGKLYLAAYALRLGATGLTFFDDEVTAFFSPHAAGKSAMFLTALGYPDIARISRSQY